MEEVKQKTEDQSVQSIDNLFIMLLLAVVFLIYHYGSEYFNKFNRWSREFPQEFKHKNNYVSTPRQQRRATTHTKAQQYSSIREKDEILTGFRRDIFMFLLGCFMTFTTFTWYSYSNEAN